MINEKYMEIFNKSTDRKDFIDKCQARYPSLSRDTFRKYYNAIVKESKAKKEFDIKDAGLTSLKQIKLNDMLRLKTRITGTLLMREGFTREEAEKILDNYVPPEEPSKTMPPMQKEEVPCFRVYKEDGVIKFRSSRNINHYEVLGFLRTYIPFLEKSLQDKMLKNNQNSKEDDGDGEC